MSVDTVIKLLIDYINNKKGEFEITRTKND